MARILVVDDNEENLYFLQALFTASGHEVVVARNGVEALDAAMTEPPELAVSDILMPGMDGFTLCRRWRSDAKLKAIPFAFYTATYTDPKDRELGLNIGADEFLVKPLEPNVILQNVSELLKKKATGALGGRGSAPAESAVLREYNAALIRKLEDKLVQLEASNQSLGIAEEFVRTVLDNSPLPTLAADMEGRITLANPAFCATFGYALKEAKGKLCSEVIDVAGMENETTLLAKQMSGDAVGSQTGKRRRKDGTVVEVEIFQAPLRVGGNVTGLLAIYRDITEKQKLEDQLRQSQKLEAVGQLAAGVAHDFNNLLSVMVGYSELIGDSAEPASALFYQAEQMKKACLRAATLTKQLLAFSRRQVLLPQVISLAGLVEEMTSMLRRLTRENIELTIRAIEPVGKILADPVQVEQVILNLVTNACDAMPNGGRLSIELSNAKVDETQARNHPSLRAKEYVKMAVSDTGIGMDDATLARIFEPFFTTKSAGSGTGLGLASVHGIVEQSGGTILISSTPGKGSCFEVLFPLVEATASSLAEPSKSAIVGGNEVILVAEDEEAVSHLVCEMLSRLGYRVLAAASAVEAARKLEDRKEHLDLLITDVVMPAMGGRELSQLAWAVRPDLRVLYVSGYHGEQEGTPAGHDGRAEFLPKPFSQVQLAGAVRKILDSKTKQASAVKRS